MAKKTKTVQSDAVETEKAWNTWVWFLAMTKWGGAVSILALLILLVVYMTGQ